MSTTPRRPLVPTATPVPGPNSGSIAQRAIALREGAQQRGDTAPPGALGGLQPMPGAAPVIHVDRPPVPGPIGHVAGAIAEVMANISTIKKGGWNNFHKYHYVRMEDILEVVTPLMGKNGLTVWQNELEIKTVENRIVVTYEFVAFHKSGEQLPPQRFTGMCIARNSRGDYDDKAILKCNTQARKYFLLSLFQVPSGDFEEADSAPRDANQRPAAVPGPGLKKITPEAEARASEAMVEENMPHKLVVPPGTTADQWAGRFLKAIGGAITRDEVLAWEQLNDGFLQRINDGYPSIYEMIGAAMERRLADLSGPSPTPSEAMPDPKSDPTAAMNWVAAQLQDFLEYDAGETFWNTIVAPREKEFEQMDWEMLTNEWQRFETRFPQEDPPAAT